KAPARSVKATPAPPPAAEATAADQDARDVSVPRDPLPFPVVGIGASAGGLEAFTHLLKALPADTGMAFVFVQHLAPAHVSALAEILSRATPMPVREVQDATPVEPNHVYVIPPGQDMVIAGGRLQLQPRQGHGAHRPVDRFFRALAEDRGHQAIGVVLSGTATDGTLGLEAIKAEGGITFAQDATAQHEGMPHSAIASGCVDFVLSPDAIAREIARIGHHPFAVPEAGARPQVDERNHARVLRLLQRATRVDFTHYKVNTLYRRITRRMVLQKIDELKDYVDFLQQNPEEVEALYHDILISVTSFFRNPEAFDALKDKVFPHLIAGRSPGDPVRIWSLGCSTGPEVYSLAMAFTEFAEAAGSTVPLQVFATDLDERCVGTARAGVYPKDIAQDVSPERLRRFFVEVDGRYQIAKSIRDVCVFSRHNVLADPPFSRIDLISCRNLLIYLEPVLQQRIMPILHYALKPSGFLWLGASETIGGYRNLFESEDPRHKIYAKKPGPHGAHFPLQHGGAPRTGFTPLAAPPAAAGTDLAREADRILMSKFAPPSVLVSAGLDILQYRGDTGPYLAPAPGKASLHLLKMLREGLLTGVRGAILRAGKTQAPAREEGLRVKADGGSRTVAVEVVPIKGSGASGGQGEEGGGFLILFDEAAAPTGRVPRASRAPLGHRTRPPAAHREDARLAEELSATREHLQSVIEQQEAANEELQSANEEVQSANEELQSVNEELETSKEEIQSSNEELATVNDELNNRNLELNRLNNDLVNLIGSVQVAIVIVGPDLRIRRFTPAAEKLFNLLPADLGRPLADIRLNLDGLPDLEPLLTEVIDTVSVKACDVRDRHGHWYSLRLRPYRTLDNKIDGVVVMLVDVDAMKRAHEYTRSVVTTLRQPLVVLDTDLRVGMANVAFYRTFEVKPEGSEGRLLYELGGGHWNIPALRPLLEQVLLHDNPFNDFEVEREFEHIGRKTMLLSGRRLVQLGNRTPSILLGIEDITERKRTEEVLRRHSDQFETLLNGVPLGVYLVDGDFRIRHVSPISFRVFGDIPDLIGRDFDEVIHILWPQAYADEIVQRFRHTLDTGEPYMTPERIEQRVDRGVTEIYEWQINRIPLPEGRYGVVCYFREISAQVQVANQLQQYASALADADRRKDEFLAMLAHELRNPLAPIRTAAQILGSPAAPAAAAAKARAVIDRQIQHMTRLIDDLLDAARITQSKIELKMAPVDLTAVLRRTVEVVQRFLDERDQELRLSLPSEPLYVSGDATRLEQALGNVLNNASKFTARGGHIWLSAHRTEAPDRAAEATVRVRDDGIGIAAETLPSVFDLFTQAGRSPHDAPGLGIGLSLVHRIVELHGGRASVQSAGVNQGTEVVVGLPLLAEAPPASPAEAADEGAPDAQPTEDIAQRILVVDDNVDAAESLADLLRVRAHDVRVVHTGPAALDTAAAFLPQVVFLDIRMKDMDGYEVARRLRQLPGLERAFIVAVTGSFGQDEDRKRARDAGFDRYIVKPLDPAALLASPARNEAI
ncbi:MAG: signal transduction histidine kinase, partial [Acidobacteria bacterium]|nr:signal transduction histidine kinase [Acidobacteriota bacterium]